MEEEELDEDALFDYELGNITKSRHIYSQARKKLSIHARSVLAVSAASKLRRASGAIAHGVRQTENARKATNVLKQVNVTKALCRDQLLSQKFSNLLAMNELEDTIASRYRAAKQYTQNFRDIHSSLSPKEQVSAIDATQRVLDNLEHARKLKQAEPEAAAELESEAVVDSLLAVDASLKELDSLCQAKTLKSRFYHAARRVASERRRAQEARLMTEPKAPKDLKKSFQRAIFKARVANVLLAECEDDVQGYASEAFGHTIRQTTGQTTARTEDPAGFGDNTYENASSFTFQEKLSPMAQPPPVERVGSERLRGSKDGTGMARASGSYRQDEGLHTLPTIVQSHVLKEDRENFGVRKLMGRGELAAKKQVIRALMLEAQLDISYDQWHEPNSPQAGEAANLRPALTSPSSPRSPRSPSAFSASPSSPSPSSPCPSRHPSRMPSPRASTRQPRASRGSRVSSSTPRDAIHPFTGRPLSTQGLTGLPTLRTSLGLSAVGPMAGPVPGALPGAVPGALAAGAVPGAAGPMEASEVRGAMTLPQLADGGSRDARALAKVQALPENDLSAQVARQASQGDRSRLPLAYLEGLLQRRPEEASFQAAAFLASGIWTPRGVDGPMQIRTRQEMIEARERVQELVHIADEKLGQPAMERGEQLKELQQLENMITFLEQICILEECFMHLETPLELQLPERGSEYNWHDHVKQLKRVPGSLESSTSWHSLDENSQWLPDFELSLESSRSLMTTRPDRIEWLKESHQAMIPCRSRHVEKGPDRKTLERTVQERHSRGLRLHCVRPEMDDMWEAYCKLVWQDIPRASYPTKS